MSKRYHHGVLVLLAGLAAGVARADETPPEGDPAEPGEQPSAPMPGNPEDPDHLLSTMRDRRAEKQSVLPAPPLDWLHETFQGVEDHLYETSHIKAGLALTHVFSWISDSVPGTDTWGTATTLDLPATWELVDRGEPTQGQLFFHLQGRWDYGTTAPQSLATDGAGSLIQVANTFEPYTPAFLVRNLYWQQGSQEAGWAFRVGKITPDATLATSRHLAAATTFLSTASVGSFAIAHPDSGFGAVGVWFPNDRTRVLGLVSDANADRTNLGDPGKGDLFKAVELGFKLWPRTENAGYSKITLWHTDGTDGGQASNGNLGPDGWGFFLKHEQELTDDGRGVAVFKYGWSDNGSALFEHLGSAHLLLYEPLGPARLGNDLVGIGFNWTDAVPGVRDEYSLEAFYRLPIAPQLDMTFAYQSIWDPALDTGVDHLHTFSLRIRTTF